jgi:uncharacterized protein
MKRLVIFPVLLLTLLVATPAGSADFMKAVKAYNGDYAEAFREFEPLAKQGDADAQYYLGLMFANGYGVLEDRNIAVKWYKLAIKQGHTGAMVTLGSMHYSGHLIDTSHPEYKSREDACIEQEELDVKIKGISEAYSQTMKCYAAIRNHYLQKSIKWFTLAAEQGDTGAQLALGRMYFNGKIAAKDHRSALKWYKPAAEKGDGSAQLHLGFLYRSGEGILRDYKAALKWFKLAADQGERRAQHHLGEMYEKGQGTPQDYTRAYMWLNIAASRISNPWKESAAKTRDSLEKKMSSTQLETAQRLARECVEKGYKGC